MSDIDRLRERLVRVRIEEVEPVEVTRRRSASPLAARLRRLRRATRSGRDSPRVSSSPFTSKCATTSAPVGSARETSASNEPLVRRRRQPGVLDVLGPDAEHDLAPDDVEGGPTAG